MNKQITVLAQPNCQPCNATKRRLTGKGLKHLTVLSTDAPELAARAHSLGHRETPVVFVEDERGELITHWSGYRPVYIDALLEV